MSARKKDWRFPLLAEPYKHYATGEVQAEVGSLPHYAQEARGTIGDYCPDYHGLKLTWHQAPMEFDAHLKLDAGIHAGRSAKYVSWRSPEGHVYPMFIAELVALVATGAVRKGGKLSGRFGVVKRGQNFGISYLGKAAS